MAAHAQDQSFIPVRVGVFILIVGFHILLVWGLANGLAHRVVELIAPPIETSLIEEIKKQDLPPPPPSSRTAPKLDVKHSPSTDDYYPPTSRRMGEEGITTVKACVSADGKTTGTAEVSKASGFPRLDEAATKWASRARWTPGTEDGKPVAMCSQFNVRFKLTE